MTGLTVLVGGTSVAAVSGGAHSFSSSVVLGVLALALAHSLQDEIRRQATRRSSGGWTVHDTTNVTVVACGALTTLVTALIDGPPVGIRIVAGALAAGYAASCCHFWLLRRRTLDDVRRAAPAPVAATDRPDTGLP